MVAEASSFQLEATAPFRPRVAVVLNLAPDHLDRHGTYERYVDAKARIFANQTEADCAVLNADDPGDGGPGRPHPRRACCGSAASGRWHRGVFVRDGWIVARLNGHVEPVCPVAEVSLRGAHNVENVLAATACALWTGMAPAAIRRGHRGVSAASRTASSACATRAGVAYYNDSKGTNVASTIKALESFAGAGGPDRGRQGQGPGFRAPRRRRARAACATPC